MDIELFGEGICSLPGKESFIRLTWTDNKVDILNKNLGIIETMPMFRGVKEGWGITRFENTLYVSDGTEYISKINAETFEPEGKFSV